MASYTAKVRTKQGVRTVEISARNDAEARGHAERVGKIISFRKRAGFNISPKLKQSDRQIFFTRLSAMLSSRVGTSDALSLIRDTFTGKIQEVAARLLGFVEGGDDLGTAFGRIGPPDFPEATVALIQAGSRSGETWKAVKDANDFEWSLYNVKKTAAKGLWSGLIGFLFAGVTTVVSTVYIGPKIMSSELIAGASSGKNGINIGWITTTGNVMGYMMGAMLLIGLLAWLFSFLGRKLFPVSADRVILKIPYYKDLILAKNNFIVLYGLALLIKSGVRTEEALRLAAEGAPKGALRRDLVSAMNAVKTGRPWAKAMETLHPTDKAALMCAQDREQIAATLDTLATQYRELYAQRLGSFVPILNLLAALFLSLSGGVLFGESILPMLMASQNML